MTETVLCYVDTETTGLDPRIHQPWEVCWWREDQTDPNTYALKHDLTHADPRALEIGGYWDRAEQVHPMTKWWLTQALRNVTLVGSSPHFDAAMLTRVIGTAVWHHRMIDVGTVAMTVLGAARPMGLARAAAVVRERGHDIPEPDHTAEGDVRTTRAVYEALIGMRRAPSGVLS